MTARRDRPLKANDPDWPVLDLEFKDKETWPSFIKAARTLGVPVAVLIREILEEMLEQAKNGSLEI